MASIPHNDACAGRAPETRGGREPAPTSAPAPRGQQEAQVGA